MIRTNTFEIVPTTDVNKQLLREVLDTSAKLWNDLTYTRRQRYFSDQEIWVSNQIYEKYKGVVSAGTARVIIEKNNEAWRSFFAAPTDSDPVLPPGYWGNASDGRELRTYIRRDLYTVEWGQHSRLEFPVGFVLKEQYGLGHYERPRFEIRGKPKWTGEQRRLELWHDDIDDCYRANQPVEVDQSVRPTTEGNDVAAFDIGINNLIACTTTAGTQYLYQGRDIFKRFREITLEIARSKSKLPAGEFTSKRIKRLYRKRTQQRDHAINALVRSLLGLLHQGGVKTIIVGDLTGIRSRHWSVTVNAKTHNFWAHRRFVERIGDVSEELGLSLQIRSEAWTSKRCPDCRSTTNTVRVGDRLSCTCGFDGHADLTASKRFLEENTYQRIRSMARPVRFKWDSHLWQPVDDPDGILNE